MPLRNPFARRPGATSVPETVNGESNPPMADENLHPGFERVDTIGSKASSTLSIRSVRSQDTGEYQMSVVNDSGVWIPPSPTENKAAWSRRNMPSRTSTDTSSMGEIEHFSISRESFDSYRRSFDICAKSPIISFDPPRQSLDSARSPRIPRSAVGDRRIDREPPTPEESFEEVGLNDEPRQHPQKRRGFLSKFSEPQEPGTSQPTLSRLLMSGRKRGQSQSGQGAELGNIERPKSSSTSTEAQELSA